jgi:aspartyl-tRNA(Asn)/glutamyl-tRNA(Gln) amidotransferase subunit A
MREADAVDEAVKRGADPGPLAGVPYAAKNLFDIEGLPTLAGSKINKTRPPARKDAVLIERMAAAGAVLVGGAGMGEYAYDFTGQNAHYGNARNPLDLERMTGGSSGGSAAAVASGMVPTALGSDTNGSIRVPAAFCGLYGLRPTYGRLPRTGTFPLCDSLDTVGHFARSTVDLAQIYDVLQGFDARDPACVDRPVEPTLPHIDKGADGLRIAVAGGYFRTNAGTDPISAVERAATVLGATAEVDIPDIARARAAAYLCTNAESSALHLNRLRNQLADFDPDTRERFLAGALLPAAWYIAAQRFRRQFEATMLDVFRHWDILLAPSTPFAAPLADQETIVVGGTEVALRQSIGSLTQPISLVGLPIAAVPVYASGPLPFGVQVISRPWREDLCLRVAHVLEQAGLGKPQGK